MGLTLPAPVWRRKKKTITHQNVCPNSIPILLCSFDYVFSNMPIKCKLQIGPGTKFLSLLGSQCARAHPENSRKIKKNKIQEENQKCDCQTIMYGGIPSKYIDWLIDWLIDFDFQIGWEDTKSFTFLLPHGGGNGVFPSTCELNLLGRKCTH